MRRTRGSLPRGLPEPFQENTYKSMSTVPAAAIAAIVNANHGDPFAVLGRHGDRIRVMRTDAKEVSIVDAADPKRAWPAKRLNATGFFEAEVPGAGKYRLRFTAHNGHVWED